MSDDKPAASDARNAFGGAERAAGYLENTTPRAVTSRAQSSEMSLVPPPPHEPPAVERVTAEAEPSRPSLADAAAAIAAPLDDLSDLGAVPTQDAPPVATEGFRGALASIGIRMRPSAAEMQKHAAAAAIRAHEEVIRQATWTRAVSVLVANKKGGTGKTPSSLLIGGMLAAVRGGGVAIVEVSDDPGQLTYRSEGSPSRGVGELVRDLDKVTSKGQLSGYTAPQTSFANVIGTVGHRPPLSRDDVVGLASVIDEFYEFRVMDSGNQPSSSAFQGAIDTADVLVVPMFNAGDAATDAVATLEAMRAQGGKAKELADNAIVLRLTDGRPEHPQVNERISRLIASAGVAQVHAIPYDPHIAERGQITLEKLAPATRAHFAAAAAGVVHALKTAVR